MKPHIKVLHLTSGLARNGAETVLFELLRSGAGDPTVTHTIVSLQENCAFDLGGLDIEYRCFDLKQSGSRWRTLLDLVRFVRHSKPDLIHAWMYHACVLSTLILSFFSPVVWGIHHALHEFDTRPRSLRLLIRLGAWLARLSRVRRIIYASERSRLQHEALGYPAEKSELIRNGFDCSTFSPFSESSGTISGVEGLSGDQGLVIGSFSRFHPIKNHHGLLEALSLLKQQGIRFRAILAGEGMTRDNLILRRWIREFGLEDRIHLLGPQRTVAPLYHLINVYALTSISESFPNVLGEAMASGVPCVSTEVGDAAWMIQRSGWVVPVKNAARFAESLREASALSMAERQHRSVTARSLVTSRLDLNKVTRTYLSLYHGLVTGQRPPTASDELSHPSMRSTASL